MNFSKLREMDASIASTSKSVYDLERWCRVLEYETKLHREQIKLIFEWLHKIDKQCAQKTPEDVRYKVLFRGECLFTDVKPTKQKLVNGVWYDVGDDTI